MAEPSIDIEHVVREVLARLGLETESSVDGGSPGDATGSSGPSPPPRREPSPPQAASAENNGQLVVLSQVVTMAELEGRLGGIRRVTVPPQAVVTPSVRDELRRRNVSLVFDEPAAPTGSVSARLVLMVLGSRFDPAGLVRALQSGAIQLQWHRADCLVAATDRLADEVARPGALGVIVSTHPAAAICLANRHRGVRAVWGIDAAGAAAAADSVGANVLVIDPKAVSLFQMKQMIGRFCSGGPRECPAELRERLG